MEPPATHLPRTLREALERVAWRLESERRLSGAGREADPFRVGVRAGFSAGLLRAREILATTLDGVARKD